MTSGPKKTPIPRVDGEIPSEKCAFKKKREKKRENDEHIRKKPVSNSENCQSANSLVYDRIFFVALPFTVLYLAHVIEQPNFRIRNPQYLQQNFCFDFFSDSENTF